METELLAMIQEALTNPPPALEMLVEGLESDIGQQLISLFN